MNRRVTGLSILAAATAVAGSFALIELARSWPVWLRTWGQDARRVGEPSASPDHFVVPLRRRSPTHVVVAGAASSVGLAGWGAPRAEPVTILLDTGASVPLLTSDGARLLRPRTADRLQVEMYGAAGHAVPVVPLAASERLLITLAGSSGAGPVYTPVWHAVKDSLHDAHVIVPPTSLAPRGGAVHLDLAQMQLTVCEDLDSCLAGDGWTPLARRVCESGPELVALDAKVNGHAARLMLDTAGSTKLFSAFYSRAGLSASESARSKAVLVGAGDRPVDAARVRGTFQLELGVEGRVVRNARQLWLVQAHEKSGPVACFPDGAVGLDVLPGCEIVLGEAIPRRGFLRCQ